MIEHQVELDMDTKLVELIQILLVHEIFVDVVIDDGKAAIQVAVEKSGQDVEQRKYILELGSFE